MELQSEVQYDNQEQNQPRTKNVICYIFYNETDDLTKIFETLNNFKKKYGLKYSHQKNTGLIFLNVNSDNLEEFAKVQPFKISKFQSKSEYTCDTATRDALMEQRDTFIRMVWNETTNTLTFMSRTTSRVHGNLVRRIFKDSNQFFNNSNYRILKNFNNHDYTNFNSQSDFNSQSNFNSDHNSQSQLDNQQKNSISDDFQNVVRKNRKNRKDYQNNKQIKNFNTNTNTNMSTNMSTNINTNTKTSIKPRVRGSNTSR